eukprot:scaffold613_cov243-Pinguiococcus_pyrenoidosus.AAC.33
MVRAKRSADVHMRTEVKVVPIARAVRSVSCACLGPMDTATTSVAFLVSLSRMASSTAIFRGEIQVKLCRVRRLKTRKPPISDLAKGIHAHLDILQLHTGLVGRHAHFYRVVNHALHAHQDSHVRLSASNRSAFRSSNPRDAEIRRPALELGLLFQE